MSVSRTEIIRRGLRLCCPNCGARTLFTPGQFFRPCKICAECGLSFDVGDGFFLGAVTINYGVTVFGGVLPVLALGALGIIDWKIALPLALICGVAGPFLLYRASRSWWLMCYFYFLPQQLPANGEVKADEP